MSEPTPSAQMRGPQDRLEMVRASDIAMAEIDWLWPGWLAKGKLHLLAGDAGTGKTTLALALAAVVSRGGLWPDNTQTECGNVLVWAGEDDPEDTTVPRLAAAGADLSRIYLIRNVGQGSSARPFDPALDLAILASEAEKVGPVAMVIVDPIVSTVTGDSHKNVEVRRALQPLVELGQTLDCAVLGITHFSKGNGAADPLLRVTGSVAFGAVARVVLVAGKRQHSEDRVLARAKSNIGADAGGVAYRIRFSEAAPRAAHVVWGQLLEGSARELLSPGSAQDAGGSVQSASDWLTAALSNGPAPVTELRAAASANGYSWRTLERVKQALGIQARKDAPDGGWRWVMPSENREDRQPEGGGLGGVDGACNGKRIVTSAKAPLQWI